MELQYSFFVFILFMVLDRIHFSHQDIVSTSAACDRIGEPYPSGCQALTAELLRKPIKPVTYGTFVHNVTFLKVPL